MSALVLLAGLLRAIDTCAAPLATLMLVSTWVGFQVGLIGDATGQLDGYEVGAYGAFLQALPYMFYPLLAFLFMWGVILTGRDFGPMARAERRALEEGKLNDRDEVVEAAGAAEGQRNDDPVRRPLRGRQAAPCARAPAGAGAKPAQTQQLQGVAVR